MKTRDVVMTVAAVIVVSTFTFAETNSKVVVVNQNNSEIFKVIYEGTIAGKVTLKVYDKVGNQLLAETTKGLSKFMRPVNFSGMEPGEYSIEITDANGTQSQRVNYKIGNKASVLENSWVKNESSIKSVHITKLKGEGKYLMSVTTEGTKRINVRIFDEAENLLHSENVTVNGSTGLVYNLSQVQGQPTFLVIDNAGNKKVIK